MVAHSTFSIPEDVFKFMVVDDWFPLSGQEGHEKEGVLHLILRLLETNYVEFNVYKLSKGLKSFFDNCIRYRYNQRSFLTFPACF